MHICTTGLSYWASLILLLASSSLVRKNDNSLCNLGCVVCPGPETSSCMTIS